MATLSQKTDEIAALESLKKDLAKFEMIQAKATKADVKVKIAAKIKGLRAQIKAGKTKGKDVSAKQLANALLRSRKKFLEMSKKDFNGVIRQLSKKPEYSFLKGMSRTEVINDINRKAKPVGWRFKGRGNYKTPTKEQVRKGRANGTVYYENRPNRSDVSQARQLEKGGSTYADSEFGKLEREWNETGIKPKGYNKAKADWQSKGGSTYAKGGSLKRSNNSPLLRYVNFEDGWHINLKKLKSSMNQNGKPYKGNNKYGISRQGRGQEQEIWEFKTLNEADTKFNELVELGKTYSNVEKQGEVKGNYARGGSLKGHGLAIGDEILNFGEFGNIYVLNRGVVYMVDLSSGKRTMTKMSKDDVISSFKDGGEVKDDPQVVRYYFEDDEYEYAKGGSTYAEGGEVDINDIEIPVHYTMFEEEMYEYGKGGNTEQKYLVKRVFKDGSKSRIVDENLSEKEAQEMVQEDIENNPKAEYYMLVYNKMN